MESKLEKNNLTIALEKSNEIIETDKSILNKGNSNFI